VIVVPAPNLVFIGIGFFGTAMIDDADTLRRLDGAPRRLDQLPQINRCESLLGPHALDAIRADAAPSHSAIPVPVVCPNELIK
jgi:hypothetical protein